MREEDEPGLLASVLIVASRKCEPGALILDSATNLTALHVSILRKIKIMMMMMMIRMWMMRV